MVVKSFGYIACTATLVKMITFDNDKEYHNLFYRFQGLKISFSRHHPVDWFLECFSCFKYMMQLQLWLNNFHRRHPLNKDMKTVSNKTSLRANFLQRIVVFFYHLEERANNGHIYNITFMIHPYKWHRKNIW